MRLKMVIETARIDEANMIDNLADMIEKKVSDAEREYLGVLRKLTIALSSIKNTIRKDPRFSEIDPDLSAEILERIRGNYPLEIVEAVEYFFDQK